MKIIVPTWTETLLFSAIFGTGLGFWGYFVLDELILAVLCITALFLQTIKLSFKKKEGKFYVFFFLYLTFFSAISFWWVDLPLVLILRYVLLFACFAFLSGFVIICDKNSYNRKSLISFCQNLLFLFFIVTVLQGVIAEYLIGNYSNSSSTELFDDKIQGRFYTQGIFWTGSAYFAVAAFTLLLIASVKGRMMLLTLGILSLVSAYFHSRTILMFVLLFSIVPFLPRRGVNKLNGETILLIIFASIIWLAYSAEIKGQIQSVIDTILFNPRSSDMDRFDALSSSWKIISDDPMLLIFGGGWQSHKILMGQHLSLDQIVRTTGLVGYIIDTGALGFSILVLVLLNFGIQIYNIDSLVLATRLYIALVSIFCFGTILYVTYCWESVLFLLTISNLIPIMKNNR